MNTKENKVDLPIIEKISFGGEISLVDDPVSRSKYKGRLFWANAGELVYSKIRVKQGSLAVVPTLISRLAVSAEYPVYTINQHIASGPYFSRSAEKPGLPKLLGGARTWRFNKNSHTSNGF